MKRIVSTLILVFATMCSFAQEIKSINATCDDYLSLLQNAGYNMFVYDISSLKNKATSIEFSAKEYVNDDLVDSGDSFAVKLIHKISQFSEKGQKDIKATGIADDEENDIFRLATRLRIGFTPGVRNTVQEVQFEVVGKEPMALFRKRLKLRDNRVDKSHRELDYYTRPFKVDGFEKGKFIPLVLYASPWWDEKYKTYRFCGDKEIPSDLGSGILKHSPHYFIIGVEFK